MNEKDGRKRREWVKNAIIAFLAVMLVLTFFSNTIMNYSLPEVATQYVQNGSITAKVRGTGNVEAVDPYNVMVKESRVIESVAVKQGDEVEKDQVLYYLEDSESEELRKAEEELEDLKLTYMKGLFGNNVSSEVISKVARGNTDGFSALQARVADMQERMDAAQARVKECQDNLDKISLQSTINSNDATVNTLPYETEVTQSTTALENAQTAQTNEQAAFEREKEDRVENLNNQITEKKNQIADLEKLVNNAQDVAGSVSGSAGTEESSSGGGDGSGSTGTGGNSSGGGNGSGTGGSGSSTAVSGGIDLYIQRREAAKKIVDEKLNDIIKSILISEPSFGGTTIADANAWINDPNNPDRKNDYQTLLSDYNAAVAQYNIAAEQVQSISSQLTNYDNNERTLQQRKSELASLNAALAELKAVSYTPGESVQNARNRLNQATQNLTEIKNANSQSAASYQNKVANAEAALKAAQAVYDLLKQEQELMNADINAELDLSKASRDIARKQEEIARLKEKSIGATINAPVAGTVTSLAYVAGETTKPEEPAAVLQVAGKGYSLSISVTNEQAKKVQVGDTAELQNAWNYEDVQVILSAIKPDPDEPGQKKLLVFDVTGESIQAGQALNISVGQRSAEYEYVVPNSAVREDNNGKFILIVESKSSPLGNRYIATRVDVEVLASDDNNTAISAGLYGYEYVITTSTKPVEAGKQVRLNET